MFLFEIHLSPYDPFTGVVGADFLRLGATTAERRSSAPSTGTSNKDGILTTAEDLGASGNSIQAPLRRDSRGWFYWHEPGTSSVEKKLVLTLDWFLLSFSCFCFFVNQLDQNTVSNA